MRYVLVVLLAAGVAAADMPRGPELPKLTKTVAGSCRVTLGPGVSGWVFVTSKYFVSDSHRGGPPPRFCLHSRVELSETKAVDLAGCTLYAIPAAEAKDYSTDKELTDAVSKSKLPGTQSRQFDTPSVETRWWRNPTPPTASFTITAIDDASIHVAETTVADTPDGKPNPAGVSMPGGWCGGFAAAVGVTAGGLWLARRRRRG